MLWRILKEPIVHFLVIGAALFAVFFALNEDQPAAQQAEIVVTPQSAERLAGQFQATWRRLPSSDELAGIIESYVDEEVLVREAKALSLDQGDSVIRQRLHQKMQFITNSAAAAIEPTDEELEDFFASEKDRYARGEKLSFEQVYLGESPSGEDVESALSDLNVGRNPAAIGVASLLPEQFSEMGKQQIEGSLGSGVFADLTELTPGEWAGPVRSGYGYHLIKVTKVIPATVPDFQVIRGQILADWRSDFEQSLADKQLEALRSRYTIKKPDVNEIEAILK